MTQQEKLPFDQWFEDNDAVLIDADAYDCAKAAWYAALRWVAEEQVPLAWKHETDDRLISNTSRNNPLFSAAKKSFCIPLFEHPHHATKLRKDIE